MTTDSAVEVLGFYVNGKWETPQGCVLGIVTNPATGAPIANADLRADGHVAGGGTFSAIGSTDDAGGAVLRLLPSDPGDATTAGAKYTITVHPPFESSFASAIYSVVLEGQQKVLAHLVGAVKRNFVRLVPGDRVEVELSPHDPTRGRITRKL